jgi:hypothetical protein
MKNRNILFVIAIFLIAASSTFAQQLSIDGTIFEQRGGKAVDYVPFATVSYYNLEDTTKLEFWALSNKYGEYTIYNLRNGKYKVKIGAPGYKTRWQEIQFADVKGLAERNNNQIHAQIAMERIDNTRIIPIIYQAKDLVKSDEETVADIITQLKTLVSNTNKGGTYRILLSGKEITAKNYNEIKIAPYKELTQRSGDTNLNKTYIEYYNLSGKDRTIADGVFNLVFNNKTLQRDPKKIYNFQETTDFFIWK